MVADTLLFGMLVSIGFMGGYLLSIFRNPLVKSLKENVSYWQGMYSSMSRRVKELELREQEENPNFVDQIITQFPILKPFRTQIEQIISNPAMLNQILSSFQKGDNIKAVEWK